MANQYKYILLLLAFATILGSGCNEDNFTQVVEIEIPEHESQPVLNLRARANQTSALQALVSNSRGILDNETESKNYPDATVRLFRNGDLFEELFYDEVSRLHLGQDRDSNPLVLTPGDTYRVEVNIPDFELAAAEQVVPPLPIVKDIMFEEEGFLGPDGEREDEVTFIIEDTEPGRRNYYGIKSTWLEVVVDPVSGDTIATYNNYIGMDTVDPLISYSNGGYNLILSDESFDGSEYQVRAFYYFTPQEDQPIVLEVYELTEDEFLYSRSLTQYYDAVDNPFAEPVTVHTNIEGGFGLFGIVNRVEFLLER